MSLRKLNITPDDKWHDLTAEERATLRREIQYLDEPEESELATGKSLATCRAILEKYRRFLLFLDTTKMAQRTVYRRLRTYDVARKLWPQEVIDAAIDRKLRIIGSSKEKPMGLYEDVPTPGKNLTPQEIELYLSQAEKQVYQSTLPNDGSLSLDAYDRLKLCFRTVDKLTRDLTTKEREVFLEDLVGVAMSLLGTKESQSFVQTTIPSDFWQLPRGSFTRSGEMRSRTSEAALGRWSRIRGAKGQQGD
jgi:hypothetical protein